MNTKIHTIDSRDNVMLEVVRDYFKMTPDAMFREIQNMASTTISILKDKGIKYQSLRSALVPSVDKLDVGFIFDTQDIESDCYGLEVKKQLLPLLDIRLNCSVLCGDLIGKDQELIFSILQESLVQSRDLNFVHGSALYCVYIHNLTQAGLKRINQSLSGFAPYVGYIPATFSSRAKTYLSGILTNVFLKNGKKIIMEHEPDRSNEENVNMIGCPFEDYGMTVYSIQSDYFGVFLSYKIERQVFRGFESDTELSLNAISNKILQIDGFDIEIEDAKYKYLLSDKYGKLKKAGIESFGKNQLANLIRSKISASYIYDLSYSHERNDAQFNIILEIPKTGGGYPTKIVVGLEYKPAEKLLRVITMC